MRCISFQTNYSSVSSTCFSPIFGNKFYGCIVQIAADSMEANESKQTVLSFIVCLRSIDCISANIGKATLTVNTPRTLILPDYSAISNKWSASTQGIECKGKVLNISKRVMEIGAASVPLYNNDTEFAENGFMQD